MFSWGQKHNEKAIEPLWPANSTSAEIRALMDRLVREQLALNSSDESPVLARLHNLQVPQAKRQHLLTFKSAVEFEVHPAGQVMQLTSVDDIRAHIFRLTVVKEREIVVSTSYKGHSKEPELASVCRDLRHETLEMFYRENDFVIQVQRYNIVAVLPWWKRAQRFRKGASVSGRVLVRTDGDPHWDNLVEWLRQSHAGEVMPLQDDDFEGGDWENNVKAIFAAVMAMQGSEWSAVVPVVDGLRRVLVKANAGWAVDNELESKAGDGKKNDVALPDGVNDEATPSEIETARGERAVMRIDTASDEEDEDIPEDDDEDDLDLTGAEDIPGNY